jgi:hypothetical protein
MRQHVNQLSALLEFFLMGFGLRRLNLKALQLFELLDLAVASARCAEAYELIVEAENCRRNAERYLSAAAGIATLMCAATLLSPALAEEVRFTLLLTNDIYKVDNRAERGGFARLNAVIKAERAKGGNVIYAHAGDLISPSLLSGLDQGQQVAAGLIQQAGVALGHAGFQGQARAVQPHGLGQGVG